MTDFYFVRQYCIETIKVISNLQINLCLLSTIRKKIHFIKYFLKSIEIKTEWNSYQFIDPQASPQLLKKSNVVNLVVFKLYDTNNSFVLFLIRNMTLHTQLIREKVCSLRNCVVRCSYR